MVSIFSSVPSDWDISFLEKNSFILFALTVMVHIAIIITSFNFCTTSWLQLFFNLLQNMLLLLLLFSFSTSFTEGRKSSTTVNWWCHLTATSIQLMMPPYGNFNSTDDDTLQQIQFNRWCHLTATWIQRMISPYGNTTLSPYHHTTIPTPLSPSNTF